ncbi:hypothetical protein MM326_19245 [Alkalihalobacillus sp. LMS6]|uniref:hypothetical protein n=1 Tax=Alkalihalobacillus sp. LMS6 TaxID=2924034 RepID=UPI0020D0DECC|nr:hypothetical protein [Alkalihalobacillus sp. LMS6]UTR06183.1 hypothetical protein MM326_19245 [Alkalihalobacillus sp. LMS6]
MSTRRMILFVPTVLFIILNLMHLLGVWSAAPFNQVLYFLIMITLIFQAGVMIGKHTVD